MGVTSIEWADHSINPFRARDPKTGAVGHYCVKISPGCKVCYASRLQSRFGLFPFLAENRDKVELFLDESKLREVLRRRKPTRYFWCDMTDMFLDEYPREWIDRCFATMALTPWHTHMVLTKRAQRMREYIGNARTRITQAVVDLSCDEDCVVWTPALPNVVGDTVTHTLATWPLPSVWLGVSVEDRERKDRIELLRQTPAAVRFLSIEPLLEDIGNLELAHPDEDGACSRCGCRWQEEGITDTHQCPPGFGGRIDWVIAGGESGPNARPFDVQWARSIVAQCGAASVPCFVKQLGAEPYFEKEVGTAKGGCPVLLRLKDRKGGDMEEWPTDLRVRELPEARHA